MGAKFLREWVRTLRLIKPSVMLTAEDHTGWSAITQPQETGGIGFDAIWWAEWYHHLIGDSQNDSRNARLLYFAGLGGNEPLAMSALAQALQATPGRVIYHESHDQAGNASYKIGDHQVHSARTIQTAVNGTLNGNRDWAEARCRVVCALTLLAPGIPMFFMGEEVGAKEPYRYNDWLHHREDFRALRATTGAKLFGFYRAVIRLRRRHAALRSLYVEVLHVHDANRVLAFRRWLGHAEFLVFTSLNNTPFADGYWISHPALRDGALIEVLNSDANAYGGVGVTNSERLISTGGAFNPRLPANGVIVFQRVASGFVKTIILTLARWARRFFAKCLRDEPLIHDAIAALLTVVLRHLAAGLRPDAGNEGAIGLLDGRHRSDRPSTTTWSRVDETTDRAETAVTFLVAADHARRPPV